ncbi:MULTISPECIES: helix-turn-helix transcriptional regulator [Kluyvera]|uniref:helix-turn-helix transcriptional regulator n=1 Tax=Kluyvera TaxID=579 RepID=UPI001A326201|nr:AlpA family phage regulatory protein [Kluyvera ascorbata]HAT1569300.1 AlpA family phage regulatory protein [Kluyvera cryocrescens]HDG1692795.1 AlpA family transcriptional regulator [Kluyvera georgiana]
MNDIDVIIREAQCKAITGICRTTRYMMEKEGTFPKKVQLGARAVGWRMSDIQEWIKTSGAVIPTPDKEMIAIDKALFKELLQLVLNLPDLGSKLAAIDVDSSSAATSETSVRLKPSDLLLRLSAALRACG